MTTMNVPDWYEGKKKGPVMQEIMKMKAKTMRKIQRNSVNRSICHCKGRISGPKTLNNIISRRPFLQENGKIHDWRRRDSFFLSNLEKGRMRKPLPPITAHEHQK